MPIHPRATRVLPASLWRRAQKDSALESQKTNLESDVPALAQSTLTMSEYTNQPFWESSEKVRTRERGISV